MATLKKFKILSFGEILWDMLPEGKKLGGAPANFAYHCFALGHKVRIVSKIGADELGSEILAELRSLGLKTTFIGFDSLHPTGSVDVGIAEDGSPSYTINEYTAWDFLTVLPSLKTWSDKCDVACFGSLAMRSKQNQATLQQLLDSLPKQTLRVLDLNLREPYCQDETIEFVLPLADVLKLNEEEMLRLALLLGIQKKTVRQQLTILQEKFGYKLLILTCGSEGSHLATEEDYCFTPGRKVKIKDTVGAGDAFTAAAVTNFLSGKSLKENGESANRLASYVCTKSGGTPVIPPSVLADIQ
jgi:fructokinase